MKKIVGEGNGAFYQHYPKIAVVVTASSGGRDNAMAAAWHMAVSKKPPLYCVAISAGHFTYKLIAESREFGLNFMPYTSAELVAALGGSKGSRLDKFQAFGIKKDNPLKTKVPILKDAYAAFECKLVDDRHYSDHRLLIGEIVAVHYLEDAFMEDGSLNLEKVSPALYMGSDKYLDLAGCKTRALDRGMCAENLKVQP
ncbi:MAG: flavin reductase family protein [Dehalococcoidales bacterium]|nr:flavin reductase family protein [Dehalococcoidales bacterium]